MKQKYVIITILLGVLVYVSGAIYGMFYGQKSFDSATNNALFFIIIGSMITGAGLGMAITSPKEA